MSYKVIWRVRCDGCGQHGPECQKSLVSNARAIAKGWLSFWWKYGQHHLCPECVKAPPEPWREAVSSQGVSDGHHL